MLYQFYEFNHAAITPFRTAAQLSRRVLGDPLNPFNYTPMARTAAAALDVFERSTRRYGKPLWEIADTKVAGRTVPINIRTVREQPFCHLLHFEREPLTMGKICAQKNPARTDPKVLIVAPMSGHYATLLRGTVEAMLPEHEVYITDWQDARDVLVSHGTFGLSDYIDYVRDMIRALGPDTHVMAVCQPGPLVLAAAALMAEDGDPATPASLIIMGSPIDARRSPTEPNLLAQSRPINWFEDNLIMSVPFPHRGFGRRVYPGFIQLSNFMSMNLDRHTDAHWNYFRHLVTGDGDSAQKHREFYEEYMAVMDLTAEFYLETVDKVFQRFLLPRGLLTHRGRPVDPAALTATALMTVEGEKDDISGIGQTQAAHDLTPNIPDAKKVDYVQPSVGHYGVFNGSRFRKEIQPRIRDFIRANRAKAH